MALDEHLLDNADALAESDPSGSLKALAGAGAQVRMALTATTEAGTHRPGDTLGPRTTAPSWATSSRCWRATTRRCRCRCAGACPCPAGWARSTWWWPCRCPAALPVRSAWRPKLLAVDAGC